MCWPGGQVCSALTIAAIPITPKASKARINALFMFQSSNPVGRGIVKLVQTYAPQSVRQSGPEERPPDATKHQYRKDSAYSQNSQYRGAGFSLARFRRRFDDYMCFLVGITSSLRFSALRQPDQIPASSQHRQDWHR
jgi:hypothetical protein